jgi:glycosyltransferase involved in cell wall biosynthesis
MTVANVARHEAYDAELMRAAPFRKVALDFVTGRPRTRLISFASRLGTWLARKAVRTGLEFPAALGPAFLLGRMAAAQPADLTIVHAELSLRIGAKLLARGRRVAADFEDWHSRDLLPASRHSRPLSLVQRTECALMHEAVYTSAPSDAMAAALQAAFGGNKPVVIPNAFPLQAVPPSRSHGGPPVLFWFSQTIGPGRGLELFLAAWRQTTRPSRLCLLGDISGAYRAKLLGRLSAEQRAHLEFLPLVSPAELPAVIARHDIGLALEHNRPPSRDLTITNKILQYLNAGLAVVASDTAGQREVLRHTPGAGILVALHETAELAQKLDSLLAAPLRIAAMGAAARRAAEAIYCWEKTEPVLLGAVTGALAGRRS